MDILISSMMDVVIILAKLVCHLCFVRKLNYFFGVHMCYGGVTALETMAGFFYDSEDNNQHFTGIPGIWPQPWNSCLSTLTMELS